MFDREKQVGVLSTDSEEKAQAIDPDENNQSLIDKIAKSDFIGIKNLFSQPTIPDVNVIIIGEKFVVPPLFVAIQQIYNTNNKTSKEVKLDILKFLINKNANLELCVPRDCDKQQSSNYFQCTPLILAIRLNQKLPFNSKATSAISILINNQAIINAVDSCKNTPLHYSSFAANYSLSEYLISKGANKGNTNTAGQTPHAMYLAYTKETDQEVDFKDLLDPEPDRRYMRHWRD